MLTTIIFFFALFLSISLLITICEWIYDRKHEDTSGYPSLIFLTISSCLLWSWLFYLLH